LGLDESEFLSAAQVALFDREPKWDHTLGVPFIAYVYPYVVGAARHLVRRRRRELGLAGLIAEGLHALSAGAVDSEHVDEQGAAHDPSLDASWLELPLGAVRYAGAEIAAISARHRSGTEEHLAELDHAARAKAVIAACIHNLPRSLRKLWQWCFVKDGTLIGYARSEGIGKTTAYTRRERLLLYMAARLREEHLLTPLVLTA
jgi:hypothetical protein